MPRKEEPKEILGLNRITKKRILELCKKDKLYQTPELNDVLYLHYQGFECIECLEEYTELKCLWLECNAISEIQGLENQKKLKCLFLQSNLIRKIENLHYCKELDTVNLSQNHIRKIENCGFEVLPLLNTLNLSSNYLKDSDGLKELENCKNLSVLDLSNNRIDDILVVKIFSRMPELKVLVLQGNPVVSKIPQYRKTLILECKKLTYLDSRPVFPKDRACAEAWKRGGYEEERRENERWNRKERKKMRDGVNATIQLRNKYRKPEDQISLIPSSDSEDESNKKKKLQPNTPELETNIDTIWNEISDDIASDGSLVSNINCCNINEFCVDNNQIPHANLQKEEINEEILEIQTTNRNIYDSNSDEEKEKYKPTVDAIDKISRSEHSNNEVQIHIENLNENDEQNEDNYEPLKELDEKMDVFSKEKREEQSTNLKIKTFKFKDSFSEIQKQQQSVTINQEMVTDFEELTNNMNSFIQELDRDQRERQEIIHCLVTKETAGKNVTEEKNCSLESENMSDDKSELDNGNPYTEMGAMDLKDINEDIENMNSNERTPKLCEPQQLIKNSGIKSSEANLNFSTTSNFNYIPLDISSLTRKSNEALDSLERETNELKKLLLELENKNESMFKSSIVDQEVKTTLNEENKCITSVENEKNKKLNLNENYESVKKNVKAQINDVAPTDQNNIEKEKIIGEIYDKDQDQIIPTIVDDIVESLELLQPHTNVISQTLPELRDSFNNFIKGIDFKCGDVDRKYPETVVKSQQKAQVFKELLNHPNLKEFNNDTQQNLNAQLEQIRSEQNTKVRRIVDRVYAQKDRYNDTLELIDGKLMVRNKDTNELQELPQPCQQESSDSETDYATAESDQDENDSHDFLQKAKKFRRISYKPTERKSCEDIIIKALLENNANDSKEDFEENHDEFYSLDAGDQISNLYNIDNEFINKLKLDDLNLTQIDQNHIGQCVRSYEELKRCLVLNKEDNSETIHVSENCMKSDNPLKNIEFSSEELYMDLKSNKEGVQLFECKCDSKTENIIDKHLDKRTTFNLRQETNELHDQKVLEIFSDVEQQSEEKYDIENNTDFECTNGIENQAPNETCKDELRKERKQSAVNINEDHTNNMSMEILECNFEIREVNEDLVDTISVNAEFEF
ncbi:defective transmitter release isoform 1-T5 [Cochliomyia hominivorax]